MKYFQAFLLLVLVAFHESILRGATDILGVSVDLPVMLVIVVALALQRNRVALVRLRGRGRGGGGDSRRVWAGRR